MLILVPTIVYRCRDESNQLQCVSFASQKRDFGSAYRTMNARLVETHREYYHRYFELILQVPAYYKSSHIPDVAPFIRITDAYKN